MTENRVAVGAVLRPPNPPQDAELVLHRAFAELSPNWTMETCAQIAHVAAQALIDAGLRLQNDAQKVYVLEIYNGTETETEVYATLALAQEAHRLGVFLEHDDGVNEWVEQDEGGYWSLGRVHNAGTERVFWQSIADVTEYEVDGSAVLSPAHTEDAE